MMDLCVNYYEANCKKGMPLSVMQRKENLIELQKAIQDKEKKFYTIGELADCIFYCSRYNR